MEFTITSRSPRLDTQRRSFYQGWLVLGIIQFILASLSTGCTSSGATSQSTQLNTAEAGAGTGAEVSSVQTPETRLQRTFFERSVAGTIQYGPEEISSDVEWQEETPRRDMSDRKGCASYEQANGARICFNVMADVTSLGVNGDETTLENGQAIHPCLARARFAGASKSNDVLHVTFESTGACADGAPVKAQFTLRQI
jgi:hypothetical protein